MGTRFRCSPMSSVPTGRGPARVRAAPPFPKLKVADGGIWQPYIVDRVPSRGGCSQKSNSFFGNGPDVSCDTCFGRRSLVRTPVHGSGQLRPAPWIIAEYRRRPRPVVTLRGRTG